MKKSDDELESSSVSSETDVNVQASKKTRLSRKKGIATSIAQFDSHSSGDESKGSSNPSIIAATNQDLILTISDVTDDKGHLNAMLLLSDTRPNTHLGAEQGDHVTAYVNFLQVLITNVETMEIQKATKHMMDAASAILPEKKDEFKAILEKLEPKINRVITKVQKELMIKTLSEAKDAADLKIYNNEDIEKAKQTFNKGRRSAFMEVTQEFCTEFLKIANAYPEIAFKRTKERDSSEGQRVKTATHILKSMNSLEHLSKTYHETFDINKKFKYLYDNFIKPRAIYKDGINQLLSEKTILPSEETEASLTWDKLKKSWKNVAAAEDSTENDKKKCIEWLKMLYENNGKLIHQSYLTRSSSSNEATTDQAVDIISKNIGELYDFKYNTHGEDENNLHKLLFKVTARHLVCMFHAYDSLKFFDETKKENIINKFLKETVLEREGWQEHTIGQKRVIKKLDLQTLKEGINRCADFNSDFKIKESEEAITTIMQNVKVSHQPKAINKGRGRI